MTEVSMLTTEDNPFDPFEQYDEWYAWDMHAGYHTPGLLARICVFSSELSEFEQSLVIDQAMDTIVEENFSGVHKKVTKKISSSSESS